MLFLSDDVDYLESLMERFPNLHLDITSGTEMYYSFTADPVRWKAFFQRYHQRILYGTDNCNRTSDFDRQIGDTINDLQKRFLTCSERFPLWDDEIQGFGLEQAHVEDITCGNFCRFVSSAPRPVDKAKAKAYIRKRLENNQYQLTDRERKIMTEIYDFLDQ